MYFDKKNIKHLADKRFSMFNGVWKQPIEYTKNNFGQLF